MEYSKFFLNMFNVPNEGCWKIMSYFHKGGVLKLIFRRLMVEKRKSAFKCPYWCRRNRTTTPDLLFPYLLGPELFISPPMLTVQTRPVYSIASSGSSLSSVSPFILGYSSSANPMVSFDSNLVSSNFFQYTLNLVLSKIFQLDRQHSLFFHNE